MQWEEDKTDLPRGLHWGRYNPWYEGIDFQGAVQLKYLKDFYETHNWHKMSPMDADDYTIEEDGDLIIILHSDYMKMLYTPSVTTDENKNMLIAYFAETDYYPVIFKLPASTVYDVEWFLPETGTYEKGETICVSEDGTWKCPEKPYLSDAIMIMTKREQ